MKIRKVKRFSCAAPYKHNRQANRIRSLKIGDVIRLLIIPILIVHGYDCSGQKKASADSASNLIPYFDRILIKANISSQTDDYFLTEKTGPGLVMRANNEYKMFLSLDYQFIGFSYGFSPRLFGGNNDDYLKGKSSFTDYKFFVFIGQWLQTLEYSKTRGYYVENTGDFLTNWTMGHDPFIQVPSMKNTAFSFSTSYILNRNYSFKNLIYQTEWQRHSAGSLVPSLYYDLNKYYFDLYGTQSSQRDFNIRAAIGYYYTFIIHKNFFIAPSIVPSAGIRLSREMTTKSGQTETNHRNYFTQYLDGGLKLGFSSDRFVAGCGLNFSANWYKDESSNRIENDKTYGILYFGYRFGTPRIVQKGYDYFDSKINR